MKKAAGVFKSGGLMFGEATLTPLIRSGNGTDYFTSSSGRALAISLNAAFS